METFIDVLLRVRHEGVLLDLSGTYRGQIDDHRERTAGREIVRVDGGYIRGRHAAAHPAF